MALELSRAIQHASRWRLQRQGAQSRTLVVRGNEVHLLDLPGTGEAPPVILLHGLGSSGLTWFQVMPGLAQISSRVLAADLPGSGFSPTPSKLPGIEESVRIVEALYERELGGQQAIVVGNSLGGALAAELAARRPDLTRALVMVAPAGAQLEPARFQELVSLFTMRSWRDGREFMRRIYHRAPPLVPELLARDMVATFGQPHVRELLQGERGRDHLEPELLRGLQMPVLLLWGRSEKILPYESIDYFRAHLPPHAVIEEVEGWGHVPHLDRPRQLVDRLGRFIAELPKPA